jgi:hypothetical protein
MAAGPQDVAGTQVGGATSLGATGHEHENGAKLTLADDIASINAAQQSTLTLPDGKGTPTGWGKIVGKTSDGGY